jgi:nitrite reductase/ring-hydroxylating ferredoxin subunit
VVWVNEWFSPPKETEAATSLINGGADVLFQNTDSPAVLKTAEEKGKRAFGWDRHDRLRSQGPPGLVHHQLGPVLHQGHQGRAGRQVETGQSWWGVKEGAIDLVSIADDVPAETKAKVEEVKKGLKDGSFVIWKGPIKDRTARKCWRRTSGRRQVPRHQLLRQGRGRQGARRRQEVSQPAPTRGHTGPGPAPALSKLPRAALFFRGSPNGKILWHPVALASAVQGAPLAACLLEQPLVLWRDDAGQVQAFADRCPHRGARCRWAGARGPAGVPLPRLAIRSRRALRAGAGAARFHATGLALCQHLRLQRGARPGLGAIGARRRGQGCRRSRPRTMPACAR